MKCIIAKCDCAWAQYTLTDDDRKRHWDGDLLATAPKGGRFDVAPADIVSAPESVRGKIRKMFAEKFTQLVAGVFVVPDGQESDAAALVTKAEAFVAAADARIKQEWAKEFPDWWSQANDFARYGCTQRGFDKPQPYWVRAHVYMVDMGGTDSAQEQKLQQDAENSRHDELVAGVGRWCKIVKSRKAFTLGHLSSISRIVAKGVPVAKLPAVSGKATDPVTDSIRGQWASALQSQLPSDVWGVIAPLFVQTPEPMQTPAPEPEPQPEPAPEPEPEPAPEPQPEPEPASTPAPEPESKPESKPEPEPKPQPKPEPEPKPQPKPESKPAGFNPFAAMGVHVNF